MSLFEAILYGILQGVAEFLPISSSGHLALAQNFFGTNGAEGFFAFNVLLHFATLLAVLVMYRKEVLGLCIGACRVCKVPFTKCEIGHEGKLFLMLCIATLVMVPAALLEGVVEFLSGTSFAVGICLIVNAALLFVSDRLNKCNCSLKDGSLIKALYIGLFQLLGIFPGISRSGITITGGLFNGIPREEAVKFSFLMSIPAVLGATVLELKDINGGFFTQVGVLPCFFGMLAAFVSGLLAIKLLQFFARKNSFTPFAVYSLFIGTAAIVGDIIK